MRIQYISDAAGGGLGAGDWLTANRRLRSPQRSWGFRMPQVPGEGGGAAPTGGVGPAPLSLTLFPPAVWARLAEGEGRGQRWED